MILNIKFTCVHEKNMYKKKRLVNLKSNIIFNKIGNDIKYI